MIKYNLLKWTESYLWSGYNDGSLKGLVGFCKTQGESKIFYNDWSKETPFMCYLGEQSVLLDAIFRMVRSKLGNGQRLSSLMIFPSVKKVNTQNKYIKDQEVIKKLNIMYVLEHCVKTFYDVGK